ncbi:hypothetical protein M8J77_000736 [Diaphorina citri]|nr:hypothetical protein M8J77_000736 [Diaphorina citri]
MEKRKVTLEMLFDELGSMRAQQGENHTETKSKLENIGKNLDSAKQLLDNHSKQLRGCDYEKRRKNLVIYGVPEDENDLDNLILNFFRHNLQVNDFSIMELDFCRRLGKNPNPSNPRPILVGLTTQRRKTQILRNTPLLKGSRIFVRPDAPPEIRETQKKLRAERNNLRREGKYAVINKGKLVTNEENYVPRDVSQQTGRAPNKRAHSISPIGAPLSAGRAPKKIQHLSDVPDDLLDTTVIENAQIQNVEMQDPFDGTPTEFRTPIQSPLPQTRRQQPLLQPSILSFVSDVNSQSQAKGKNE